MIRVVIFLAFILAVALGVAWIADRPGQVVITWLGRTVELDILTAIIALLVATIALMVTWSLIRLVLRLPSMIAFANRTRRRQKGFEAVARGMVAVSAGDARTAQKQSAEAQRLLGREPLTMLLAAQSAQLAGDGGRAEKAFTAMLEHKDTRLVGLRGLHIEANRKGDGEAATFYAAEAYKLAPSADWASEAALAQRCRERDWLGAMALVEQAVSRRLIDKETGRRQRAVLLTADALDRGPGQPDAALRAAQEAVKLAPALAPAAAYLGRRLSDKGDYRGASKVLENAWKQQPHPEVAEAYLDVRLGDAALDRLKRAKVLQRLQPRDPESRLVVARAAIDARDFRQARENLETLVLESPTVRACLLMAELEEAESGDMGRVREWLARASRAPRDKAWVADGRVSETWAPVSPAGKLDGYAWEVPPQAPHGLLIDEIRSAPPAAPVVAEPAPMPPPIDVGLPEPKAPDVRPPEPQAAEPKQVEPKPVEAKPVEAKPVETNPVEAKPADSKPVEPVAIVQPPATPVPVTPKPQATEPAAVKKVPEATAPRRETVTAAPPKPANLNGASPAPAITAAPVALAAVPTGLERVKDMEKDMAKEAVNGSEPKQKPLRWYQPTEPPPPPAPLPPDLPVAEVVAEPPPAKPKRWFQP